MQKKHTTLVVFWCAQVVGYSCDKFLIDKYI
jgi:hypothetical protein